jgi:uncharacterized protein YkwD
MLPHPTPRHRAAGQSAAAPRPRRREPARHLRTGPARAGAITAGIAAVAVLAPSVGLTAATVTGELSPDEAGPLGPVVEALPWQDRATAGTQLAERQDAASRSDAGRTDLTGQDDASAEPDATAEPGDSDASGDPVPSGTPSEEPADAEEPADVEGPADAGQPAGEPAQPAAEAAPAPTQDAPAGTAGAGTTATPSAPASAAPAPASPAPTATPTPAPTETPAPSAPTAEVAAVVALTNAERAAAGCSPLVVDDRLTAAAQLHSEDMLAQDYFDHTSLDGRSPWDRAAAQGYPSPSGENIAKGQRTAEEVVRAWMESPGHRANILNCDSREIGVGYADGVWTQLFGRG